MKRPNQNQTSLSKFHLLSFISAGCLWTAPAAAQVVIEAGPGVVQISDRDGKTEPVIPGEVPGRTPLPIGPTPPGPATLDPVSARIVESQLDPAFPRKVLVAIERPALSAPNRVASPAPASPAVPPVNVDVAKRKAELKRELGIADSGTGATVALAAENLFEVNVPMVTAIATNQLFLLAEFIGLCDQEGVSITYHYAPVLHGEGLAWKRSVALVEWLKVSGGLSASKFTIVEPVVVTAFTPTEGVGDTDTALPQNRVVIVVDYR